MSSTHAHSHGPDPDAPPPTEEALARRRRAVWLMLLLLVPVGLATVIGLIALWPGAEPTRAELAAQQALPPGTTYPDGRIVSIETFDCGVDPTGPPQTCATAVVEVLGGEGAGDFEGIDMPPEVVAAGVSEGETLVLTRDAGAEGGPTYAFYDYARDTPIIVLAVAFALVVGVVARLRGLASLLGLAFAFFVLLQFVLPGLLTEEHPTLVSLVGSAAIMFVVLYLAHGFSARTTTALVGTLFGLTLVAVMGSLAVSAARLTGLTDEDAFTLQRFDPTLSFSGLVLAGIVVAGLGVLNDVTITQASAIWQLHEVSPEMTWRELYTRGMTVGRDHIASTVYTIVFAYAGAALPLLLLLEIYATPVWTLITSAALAEEVIRTLVGAIALVLAVPVTTAAGAFFAKAADTQAGTVSERGMTALRTRFAR
ncbi:YibE/F family protein [Blastococcus sp. VKM Ac-2987]|uniref:YibE/F family protein n=1 Tax=Blastococcus sp. VKM Ac-2987 TaxID=3004141 RepID=UPI0022ABA0FD|nr:YibE/F family protein [Blastococcus sp. VKM Ac-2987]MCZ2860121.1 YibE/F family protein [Blastococcus sp. VKM Ac-2987]